jgi:GTP-binding protein HflX
VLRILADLGIDEKEGAERIVEVWNKIDKVEPEVREALVKKAASADNTVAVSAMTGEGVDDLLAEIGRRLSGVMTECTVVLGLDQLQLLPWVYQHAIVDGREDLEDGRVSLDLRLTEGEATELERRLGNGPKAVQEDW